MVFTGTYELTIDPQNRLSIPSSVRAALDPDRDGRKFYLVPGWPKSTLRLYADRYFERYAEQYHAALDPNEDRDRFEQVFYALATLLDVDKQGRVVLPQRIVKLVGLGREVVMSGAFDHLILWNRAEYGAVVERNWDRHPDYLKMAQQQTQLNRRNGGPHGNPGLTPQ